jgi:hypothetical protein
MAMQIHACNRTKSNLENKVGTKLESLKIFPREFIGESEGYRAQAFANPFALMKRSPHFHRLRQRPNQNGSEIFNRTRTRSTET